MRAAQEPFELSARFKTGVGPRSIRLKIGGFVILRGLVERWKPSSRKDEVRLDGSKADLSGTDVAALEPVPPPPPDFTVSARQRKKA